MSVGLPAGRERNELSVLLEDLTRTVEELLLTGLGAASDKTRQNLAVSFQKASAKKLLRLGSTLRVAVEELGRYAANDPSFSRSRYAFFINRAWMMSRGLREALSNDDEAQWRKLTWRPGGRTVDSLRVVSVGVLKRVVPKAFVAFEFRLRALEPSAGVEAGERLIWSTIFPIRAEASVPPEAYLHLPQKQKFKAVEFLPGRVVTVEPVELSDDGRISFRDDTEVTPEKEPFERWEDLLKWEPKGALERLEAHRPGPFDLDIELSEEIVLDAWQIGEAVENERERKWLYPIETPHGIYHAPVGAGAENGPLREALETWRGKKKRPPLFGVLHYAECRFMLEPVTLFGREVEALALSKQSFDPKSLVSALKYT